MKYDDIENLQNVISNSVLYLHHNILYYKLTWIDIITITRQSCHLFTAQLKFNGYVYVFIRLARIDIK